MTALLNADAVNAERETLRARLAALDELERLAAGLAGNGNGVAAAAATPKAAPKAAARKALPPKAYPTQTGLDGLSALTLAILEVLRAAKGEWVVPGDLPSSSSTRSVHMERLVGRGLIERHGHGRSMKYRAVIDGNNARAKTTFGDGRSPRSKRNIQQERVLAQLKHHRLNEAQLMGILDVGRETVAEACGALLVDEKIILRPDGCYVLAGAS